MNPYSSPPSSDSIALPSVVKGEDVLPLGEPCKVCKSANTTQGEVLKSRPNLLFVICFGWVPLLIRAAFVRKREVCRDCGAINYYRTAGNNIALVFLVLLAFLVAIIIFTPPSYA